MEGTTQTGTLTALPLPSLPFDLVAEILCRLPVKHLLQLCCVCKSWNSLIFQNSKFTKKHLRFTTSNHDRHHVILSARKSARKFYVSDSSISSIFSSAASFSSFKQLIHPLILNLTDNGSYGRRVSTCDGMICVEIDPYSALLCNPSIRKFKILPPISQAEKYFQTLFTLVYHRFTNNYNIIALSLINNGNNHKSEINVHTLGTDYWRKIQDFPEHYLLNQTKGIFVSDTVNWLLFDHHSFSSVIGSLGLENELYQELSLPLYDYQHGNGITLGVLRDCLCIFPNSDNFSYVWIMKEYGNGQSWTKLLRVPQMGDRGYYALTKALYISEDDQVLMYFVKMGRFSLAVYDSINDTFKIPKIQNNINDPLIPSFCIPEVYVESLISPFLRY